MNKKELIAKLLEKLSEDDLVELLGGDESEPEPKEEKVFNTHIHSTKTENSNNRRKGRGHSKNKASSQETTKKKKRKGKSRGASKGRSCRVMPIDTSSPRVNKFEEMIGSANLDPNEKVELSKASQEDEQARTQRTNFKKPKRGSSLVDVECCVCGDEYEISSTLVANYDRWKCNPCSTQAG